MILLFLNNIPVAGQMFEWVSSYKTEGASSGVSAIATDAPGNVYHSAVFIGSVEIEGQILTTTGSDQDAYIAKYDSDGNFLWVRHISGARHQSIYAIAITSDNHIVATGSFQSQLSIDGFTLRQSPDHSDFSDTFVLKFDQGGTVVMAINIGFKEDNMADQGFGITLDAADNIYVAGGKGQRMFFIKTSSSGTELWRKTYGFATQVGSISAGPITADASGNIYVSGFSGTTGYLFKIDKEGKTLWTQTFNGFIDDLKTDRMDQLIVCGSLRSSTVLGGVSFQAPVGIIGKMDSNGSFSWQRSMEGFIPRSLSVNAKDQHIYFSGAIRNDVAFGGIIKQVHESSDIMIGAVSPGGSFSWVAKVGEENGEHGDLIDTDKSGNIFIANRILKDSVAVFQCQQKTGQSKRDIYVAKISPFLIVPIAGPAALCPDEEGTYSYTPVSPYIQYEWNVDTNQFQTVSADDTSISIRTTAPGHYEISIATPVDLGCENFIVNHTVPVVIHPIVEKVSLSGKDKVCAGDDNVTFTVTSDISGSDYTWIQPADVTVVRSSATELVVNFPDTFAEGEIFYVQKGNCNNAVSDPFPVIVNPMPGPATEIESEPVVCAGTQDNLFKVELIPNAHTYAWDITYDGATGRKVTTENFIKLSVPQNVWNANISVTGLNDCGSSVSPTFSFEVKHKPEQPTQIVGPVEVCKGEELILETLASEQIDSFHWLVRDKKGALMIDVSSGEPKLSLAFTQSVVASVSTVNMCGESPALTVTVEESIDPDLVLEIKRDCDVLYHEHDQELFWLKDGVPLGSGKAIRLDTSGEYVLRFLGQCTIRETSVKIDDGDISEFIPNIFTPNGDEKNEYFEVSPFLEGSTLTVFNRWGGEVYASAHYKNDWDGGALPSGVYFYALRSHCSGKILRGAVSISK
ncbi:MAG: gliding motility-associated C-terminal domain-containing protein [Chryseosolibacter sp.]